MGRKKKKQKEKKVEAKPPKHLYKVILLGFCLSGMAALIYEVAWTRSLQLIFGTTVYAVSTMLTAFMAGLALGSWLLGRYTDRIRNPLLAFSLLELGIGIYGVLLIPIFNVLPYAYLTLFHKFHGSFISFSFFQFLLCFGILLIPTTLMGGTFPVVSKIYTKRMEVLGKDIGTIYSVNNFGAILGSFSAGFLLIPFVGVRNTIIIAASLNILVAILIFFLASPKGKMPKIFMVSIILFALITITVPSYDARLLNTALYQRAGKYESKEELTKALETMEVLYFKDGLHGTVAVFGIKGTEDRGLHINGKADASTQKTDMITQLLSAYIPLALHKQPKNILIIGLGGGFTLGASENFDLEKIDMVEIDPLVIEAEKYFSDYNGNALADERVNLVVTDGRNYLFSTNEKYDVIISEPSNPWISAISSNLFTQEFFGIAKEHLNEDGIFCQWVQVYDTFVPDFKILLNTFNQTFRYTTVWTTTPSNMLFIGSDKPIKMNYEGMVEILAKEEIKNDLQGIDLDAKNFLTATFMLDSDEIENFVRGAPLNTDDKPIIEFSAPKGVLAGADHFDVINEVYTYKGNSIFKPPMDGLEEREGDLLKLDFMKLSLKLGREWSKEFLGVIANRVYDKTNHLIVLNSWRVAEYKSEGHLSIEAYYFKQPPAVTEISSVFGGKRPLQMEISGKTAYFTHIEDGENKTLLVIWYCDENSLLYQVSISYPSEAWEAKTSEVESILSSFECISTSAPDFRL